MGNMRETIEIENRRRYVLAKLHEAGRAGYQVQGDEPEWWRDVLLGLNNDLLCYPDPASLSGSRFTWHLSPAGEKKFKAVRS
jgi:hypothetical protein